jgi:hypothetical protein
MIECTAKREYYRVKDASAFGIYDMCPHGGLGRAVTGRRINQYATRYSFSDGSHVTINPIARSISYTAIDGVTYAISDLFRR